MAEKPDLLQSKRRFLDFCARPFSYHRTADLYHAAAPISLRRQTRLQLTSADFYSRTVSLRSFCIWPAPRAAAPYPLAAAVEARLSTRRRGRCSLREAA